MHSESDIFIYSSVYLKIILGTVSRVFLLETCIFSLIKHDELLCPSSLSLRKSF